MIEPYAVALSSCIPRFMEIGFLLSEDTEYAMTFSNGNYAIEISTEKYYQPSMITRLLDKGGNKFSIRMVREILSLQQLEKDSLELSEIKRRYGLDNVASDNDLRAKGNLAYVSLAVKQLLDFLVSYRDELFSTNNSFQDEYRLRENSILEDLARRS